jgi:hypothetical protein
MNRKEFFGILKDTYERDKKENPNNYSRAKIDEGKHKNLGSRRLVKSLGKSKQRITRSMLFKQNTDGNLHTEKLMIKMSAALDAKER